jgi:antirestriction protein ArdC
VKTDIAQSITNKILAKLEAGTKPWVKPWTGGAISRPLRHCGAPYRGINTLLLWMEAEERGFSSPYWMTYRQAEIFKGQVRKGEKCSHAVFYKTLTSQDEKAGTDDGNAIDIAEEGGSKTRRLLRQYALFNADQIDGLPELYYPRTKVIGPLPESEHRPQIESFFAKIPAIVRHNGFRAYYNRTRDEIVLPPIELFNSYLGYAAVRGHESAHWAGAEKRLNRTFGKRFGDAAYAMEELVADISAAVLGAALGLPEAELDNHASYLAAWLTVLKSDKTAILTAASKADETVDYLMGFGQAGASRIIDREPQLIAA